jgi:hypothetical protein
MGVCSIDGKGVAYAMIRNQSGNRCTGTKSPQSGPTRTT